jgi:carboxyl-terminal processing protease
MQHSFRRAGLVFLVMVIALCWLPYQAAVASNGPQQLYQSTWQLVKDSFYDPTYNHQNWESWHHKYDGKLQSDEQAYEAIRAMLGSLKDPYTRFLDPKTFGEENDAINSFVCGIGISLRPWGDTHALIVNDVIEGGPAARAGIEYGDEIIGIDGKDTKDTDTDKAAGRIRGRAGTALALKIKHGTEFKDCKITRAQVCIPSVTAKMLEGNIGYIKLSTFMADDASNEFRLALQRFAGVNGLIIDLRDNPGGLLANAVEIADMLMDHGDIVSTESRRGRVTDACTGGVLTDQPIAVLVDHDSASASEILAGALKDNHRATIIGNTTYGKGLVQEINRLPNGAGLHITVARYFTPNGSDINKIGIKPDVTADDRNQQLAEGIKAVKQSIAEHGNGSVGNVPSLPTRRYGDGPQSISPRS